MAAGVTLLTLFTGWPAQPTPLCTLHELALDRLLRRGGARLSEVLGVLFLSSTGESFVIPVALV